MTLKEALNEARKDIPSKEARLILCNLLNIDEISLILKENETLEAKDDFFSLIKRRKNYEPLEYINKKASFFSKDFFVNENVLIPRPETEILVELTDKVIKENSINKIAEIGTGSGIISIVLALLNKNLQITATDISKKALEVAQINAQNFKVSHQIKFIHTSLLDDVKDNFKLIVSNPPYIAKDYKLDESVLQEPHNALFGGEKGDEILQNIIKLARNLKVDFLLCEMGYDQKNSILKAIKENENIVFYKDLANLNRGFELRFINF